MTRGICDKVAEDVIADFEKCNTIIGIESVNDIMAEYIKEYAEDDIELAYAVGMSLMVDIYVSYMLKRLTKKNYRMTALRCRNIADNSEPDMKTIDSFKWVPDVIHEVREQLGTLEMIEAASAGGVAMGEIALEYIKAVKNHVTSEQMSRYRTPDEVLKVYNEIVEEAEKKMETIRLRASIVNIERQEKIQG